MAAQDHIAIGQWLILDSPYPRPRGRCHARAAARAGAPHSRLHSAERVKVACDVAALVGDQPGHDDRHVLEGRFADPDVGAIAMDHQAQATRGSRRGQCRHLGRAQAPAASASGSRAVARA